MSVGIQWDVTACKDWDTSCRFLSWPKSSEVFATVGAVDVFLGRQEASADQRRSALFAVEAVVVPLALLKGDVLAAPQA